VSLAQTVDPHEWKLALQCWVQTLWSQVVVPLVVWLQAMPHPPQWLTLVFTSTQVVPLHKVGAVEGHELVQPVGEQLGALAGHAVAQSPQWAADRMSVSQPSSEPGMQSANPGAQAVLGMTQLPAEQVTVALAPRWGSVVQSCPQLPQFFGSVEVETQALPQRTPLAHCITHVLFWQVAVPAVGGEHSVLQSPQCLTSVLRFAQLCPHCVVPAGHALVQPADEQNGAPALHDVAQSRQCSAAPRSVSQPSSASLLQCPNPVAHALAGMMQ
jgi:hypothetical protein